MRRLTWTAIAVAVAMPSIAMAGDVTLQGGQVTAPFDYCVGTLNITADSMSVATIGNATIRGVDTSFGCDSYCGDGVVGGMEECDPAANVAGCTSNCTWIRFPEYGGTSPYIDSDGDMLACRQTPAPVPNATAGRDVTFLAFGDPQYGNNDPTTSVPGPGVTKNRLDMNIKQIKALNRAEELTWPPGFVGGGQNISNVRGVIIAGDIAQEGDACTTDLGTGKNCGWIFDRNTRDAWYAVEPDLHPFTEWAQFRDEYGLCGDKELIYPAFEGAGNHDYFRDVGEEHPHPIHKYIAYRNNFRQGVDRIDPLGKGHYSWTWDDVHFVQLNLTATDNTIVNESWAPAIVPLVNGRMSMKPYSALTFLKRDLALHAAPGQPVVLISHYPWANSSRFPAKDRLALFEVIKNYNVVALVHGHTHSSKFRTWSPCDDVTTSNCAAALGVSTPPAPYPVIDAGNPFYGNGSNRVWGYDGDRRRYSHYSAVRITPDYLEVASVSAFATGSACDHATAADCVVDAECTWNSTHGRCSKISEICLPGVATMYCDPFDPPAGGCDPSKASGGWTARVRLSDRAVVYQSFRALHEYCP